MGRLWIPHAGWMASFTAFLAVVAVALHIGVPYFRQMSSVQWIEDVGGKYESTPVGPKWFRDRMGEDRMRGFNRVVAVYLGDTQITDAELKHLSGLTSLRILWLDDTTTSDAGVKHLVNLKRLQWLNLEDTAVTNACITELTELKDLHKLDLSGTRVTDAGLKRLAALKDLEWLFLWNTESTNSGVMELQRKLPALLICHY